MSQPIASFQAAAIFLVIAMLLLVSSQSQAYSVLRIYCEEHSAGADIYINNSHKGQCQAESPLDIFVEAKDIIVRAVQQVDQDHERVFEESFPLVEGAAKRVRVTLSSPRLTDEAAQRKKLEQLSKEKAAFEQALAKAEQGDINAMKELAGYFSEGKGTARNNAQASYWIKQSEDTQEAQNAQNALARAQAGDIAAMRDLANRYQLGKGVEVNANQAEAWRIKADTVTAANAREQAEKGSISAMLELAEYYKSGTGVEKSAEKSRQWEERADVERQRVEAQRKLEEHHWFTRNLRYVHNDPALSIKGIRSFEPSTATTFLPLYATWYLAAAASDVLTAPLDTTAVLQLKRKAASRSSAFMEPNAMVTKAYARMDHGH